METRPNIQSYLERDERDELDWRDEEECDKSYVPSRSTSRLAFLAFLAFPAVTLCAI